MKRDALGSWPTKHLEKSERLKGSSSINHHERSKKFKGSLSINQLRDGFAENQQEKSLSNILLQLLKNFKIRIAADFFAFTFAERRNFRKIVFFLILFSRFLYSQLKKYRKVTTQLDFHRNPSSSFRETDNFQLRPIPQPPS